MNNVFSKFATLTVAYNEERFIGGMLEGVKELHNLVIISKPWNGIHNRFDNTEKIAKKMGAEVLLRDFNNPAEERNFGIDLLEKQGFKYIIIIDSDEYYLKKDIKTIIEFIEKTQVDFYKTGNNVKAFWKNTEWCFRQNHILMCIASSKRLNTNQLGGRNISTSNVMFLPEEIYLYHFSYNRTNEEMFEKISTRGFSKGLQKDWYEEKWLKWNPDMKNLGPVVPESIPYVFRSEEIPEEIKLRLNKKYD